LKFRWSSKGLLVALALGGSAAGLASASPRDALQGAWVLGGAECDVLFEKSGSEIRFRTPDSSLNTGVIISGDRVTASTATCTIDNIRDVGDHFTIGMTCSSAIMVDSVTMAFRIIDETHFERFDPLFPAYTLAFAKCPM
jgi:hypothetical protein